MPARVHNDESGYSLTELLVAMSVGLIVLFAAFLLLDTANSTSASIASRQDAVQRGRAAMEIVTRQVRSQVCLGNATEPITFGDPNTVTFYADLADGSKNVERRKITFDADRQDDHRVRLPRHRRLPRPHLPGRSGPDARAAQQGRTRQ